MFSTSLRAVAALLLLLLPALQGLTYLYNIFLHPLRKYPGPVICAASTVPIISRLLRGEAVFWIADLHLRYGEVVRVSPNELSFSSASAWKEIYGHGQTSQQVLAKDPKFYIPPGCHTEDIVNAGTASHARIRRIFSNAFSNRALRLQEPLFLAHVDKMVRKIMHVIEQAPSQKVDIVKLFNFTTFDIMGDLTFGESLNMLETSSYHPWVAAIFAGFRFGTYLQCIRYFPSFEVPLLKLAATFLRGKVKSQGEFSRDRVDQRLEKHDARPDIWGLVLETRDRQNSLSRKEMYANATIFMIGGTETTATLLSGLMYHLLKTPQALERLTGEIRTNFANETEITMERLQQLRYLHACIEEGLRLYPPISNGLPRIVPPEGAVIDGRETPAGIRVYVTTLAAHLNPKSFRNPNHFIPERWLAGNAEYASDQKHGLQPFSLGPRVCLGRNMAYHEVRLILAKMLYNFDIELCIESTDWVDQRVYLMWEKGPLYCRLKPRAVMKPYRD